MLQLVVWMLCVYMILKGVELFLIASGSTNDEKRGRNVMIAIIAALFAVAAAVGFFFLSNEQVNQMPTPTFPNY